MPKINQEEYEVLKDLDDKWKWIARDEAQQTYAYEYRPIKSKLRGQWESNWNDYYLLPHDWLRFIQWEDEEPYNISDLIEEYECSTEHVSRVVNERVKALGKAWSESEETEMNKQKLIEKWESAIEAAEFYGRGKEDRLIEYMRNFVDDLNQLDEPEVLTSDWIDEHKEPIFDLGEDFETYFIKVENLQNLLVPKQEELEVKIQELIEDYKQEEDAYSNPENGWIGGFIEDLKNLVEEEQKYYAKIKGHENIYSDICFWIYDTEIEELLIDNAKIYPDVTAGYMIKATKDEWANLGINDDNADFVKVEELEE